MSYKNIVLDSLKESFHLTWKSKRWVGLLLIIEIFFLISLIIVSYNYQIEIVRHQSSIDEYISKLQLDDASVAGNLMQQKSFLGDDPLLISREFSEILKNFRLMLASVLALAIVFLSAGWAITIKAMYKISLGSFLRNCIRVFLVLLVYLGSVFLFFYYVSSVSLSQIGFNPDIFGAKYMLFLAVLTLSTYFMFISLSIASKTGLKNVAQKTLVLGIRKMHYVLGIYALSLFTSVLAIAVFVVFEKSMLALFCSTMLLVSGFVFGRFFMVRVFEKIA